MLRVVVAALALWSISTSAGGAMTFALTSSAFEQGKEIPRQHTCEGKDISPPLRWTGAPGAAKSFALIADDPDAPVGTWVHWVLYDLPGSASELPESIPTTETLPSGARQGLNDFRKVGYGGPCPPPGKPHRYFFKLYALDAPTGLQPRANKGDVLKAVEGHVLGQAELMGTYRR
jgi:Raf kinase inhibitor-like YbhB/YbcL family protein